MSVEITVIDNFQDRESELVSHIDHQIPRSFVLRPSQNDCHPIPDDHPPLRPWLIDEYSSCHLLPTNPKPDPATMADLMATYAKGLNLKISQISDIKPLLDEFLPMDGIFSLVEGLHERIFVAVVYWGTQIPQPHQTPERILLGRINPQ